MDPVNVALLGLGTVGASTVNVLENNQVEIARRVGRDLQLFGVATRDPKKQRGCDVQSLNFYDPFELVSNPEVDIVVELMGGVDLAKDLILKAFEHNKHVVTANKALIAEHGNELFEAAQAHDCIIAFEASVAGGIPIIKSIREGLGGNQILELSGIINGTCNYILTQMRDKGWGYEEALTQAQRLGFAEADPSFDVEGIDAAHKLTILASIAFGIPLQFDKVYRQGIGHIDGLDIHYAKQLDFEIKLLGHAKNTQHGIELRVHPTLIPKQSMLAGVEGAMNAVWVQANAVGPTLYYGQGAGGNPTASAVVADLIEVARMIAAPSIHRVPVLAFQPEALSDTHCLAPEEFESAAYLRVMVEDKPGTLANITQVLAQQDISIQAIIQHPQQVQALSATTKDSKVPIVIVTYSAQWSQLNQAIELLGQIKGVSPSITFIPIDRASL